MEKITTSNITGPLANQVELQASRHALVTVTDTLRSRTGDIQHGAKDLQLARTAPVQKILTGSVHSPHFSTLTSCRIRDFASVQ